MAKDQGSFGFNDPRRVHADDPPTYHDGATRAEEISDITNFVKGFDLGKPPVGKNHPDTSYKAAEKMNYSVNTLRMRVFAFIQSKGDEGATAYDVFCHFGLDKNKTSPRISELKRHGFVCDSGERRKSDGCGSSIVWKAVAGV